MDLTFILGIVVGVSGMLTIHGIIAAVKPKVTAEVDDIKAHVTQEVASVKTHIQTEVNGLMAHVTDKVEQLKKSV